MGAIVTAPMLTDRGRRKSLDSVTDGMMYYVHRCMDNTIIQCRDLERPMSGEYSAKISTNDNVGTAIGFIHVDFIHKA